MTRTRLIGLAALGSAVLLFGAFGFQALGYAPCQMCLWQRWPHAVAIGLAVVAFYAPWVAGLGALAALSTAGLGVFHTGVERNWWEGPTACSSSAIDGLTADQLVDQIMNAPLVRCDEVAWALGGVSMASWNAILSLGLAAIWLAALRHG